jgi:hypothetical protein
MVNKMSRVITFSRVFPSYHPRKGEATFFVESVLKSLYWQKDTGMQEPEEIKHEMVWQASAMTIDKAKEKLKTQILNGWK